MVFYERSKRQGLFILALVFALVCVLSEALYLPSLSHIAEDFEPVESIFENCTWVLYFGTAFSIVGHGFVADYLGRIVALFSGHTFVMAGVLLCLFANDPQEFLLATFILSLGLGSSVLMCRILARDLFQGELFVQMLFLVNFCTLFLNPIAPWIAHTVLPNSSWQTLFSILFIFVAIIFTLSHILLSDSLFRRTLNNHYSSWSLKSLYRPSVPLATTLATLSATIVFLYQSVIVRLFDGSSMASMLALPPLATLMSTVLFFISHSWRDKPFEYIHQRHIISLFLGLCGAIAWNQLGSSALMATCLFGVMTLQSHILSVATVYLLQDRISIGLSASLVSAVQHGSVGLAFLFFPLTLRNSPKDLLLLIPITIALCYPMLRVAKSLVLMSKRAEQEHETPASLSV